MFGISMWEVGMVLLVALIALGPKQLVEVAKTLGKVYGDLQRMISDVRSSVDLDSLTSQPTHHAAPYHDKATNTVPPEVQAVISPSEGVKSGPDFYADLLAASDEKAESPEPAANSNAADEASRSDSAVPAATLKEPSSTPTTGRTD